MTTGRRKTPVRAALQAGSTLLPLVADGLGALKRDHRNGFEPAVRTSISDSLDLDEAIRVGHEQDNRWDYLVGHEPSGEVVAVEPHSAKQDEITTVIEKRRAALAHLQDHIRPGVQIRRWLWVASGRVQFAATEKARFRLAQAGIKFVGTKITAKDLPPVNALAPPSAKRVRRR